MKFLVIGATGLIGSKVVQRLTAKGYDVLGASPSSGVDTLTGAGLDEAMKGVDTVIDLSNFLVFVRAEVEDKFTRAGANIAAAEKKAGVKHHVALSVVGTQELAELGSDYFWGKVAQEKAIKASGVPYTIIHSTQFMEFLGGIVQSGEKADGIHVTTQNIQPIASDDVAELVAEIAIEPPTNGIVEIGGPRKIAMSALVSDFLQKKGDARKVVGDENTLYFGAKLGKDTLVPRGTARLGKIGFDAWFASQPAT